MRTYRRITFVERCQISAKLQVGLSISEIALELGFHKSSISREIRRNSNQQTGVYSPEKAETKTRKRVNKCRRPRLVRGEVLDKIAIHIYGGWSPKQISNRYKLENKPMVSHQTIYSFIKRRRSPLHKELRTYKKTGMGRMAQRKRNKAKNKENHISQRCRSANNRTRIGHFERDTFYIANREQILAITDRKTRYTLLEYVGKANGEKIMAATTKAIGRLKVKALTMTNDNGTEFRRVKDEGFKVFQCTPYKPQERGTVENTIGLIRQYIKRKTQPLEITTELLRKVENRINFRPKKVLNYRTPYEAMNQVRVALAT